MKYLQVDNIEIVLENGNGQYVEVSFEFTISECEKGKERRGTN